MIDEKRPRQYAAEIMAVRDKDERRALFARVPEHLRDIVYDHCQTATRLAK